MRCLILFAVAAGAATALLPAQRRARPAPLPTSVTFVEDLQYAEGVALEPRRNRLDLYVPKDVARPPLVMFVHGGTWIGGSKDRWGALACALCARGFACAAINTQLHPVGEPTDMVADCGRALAFLHQHAGEHGYDGEALWLMGHSSGAHLVTWLAFDDARREATGVPRAALRGVIGLSGVYELRSFDIALDKVFGTEPGPRALASPFLYAGAGDPPVCLLWGERDIVRLPLGSRMLRDRLHDAGVPVTAAELPGRNHADYVLQLGQRGDQVLDRIVAWMRQPGVAAAPTKLPDRVPAPAAAPPISPPVGLVAAIVPAPAGTARTCLVWVVAAADEQDPARGVAAALAPFGVTTVLCDARNAGADAVAATWRELR
ncbi:MAG: alpha/beta hydrolase, partial [Planctomycetota bacterium]